MDYPFLRNNELVLVDYLPGSSGQLLLRLWSELDSVISYDVDRIISNTSIENHPSTREIEYDIMIPKRLTNWFLDRCVPTTKNDHAAYFEFLATTLVALSEKWKRGDGGRKFYDSDDYELVGQRKLYGIHTWHHIIPFREMIDDGLGIRRISIVPETDRGKWYQFRRCTLCYPGDQKWWQDSIATFNAKPFEVKVDLCTMLVDGDTGSIIRAMRDMIGDGFREDKVRRATEILDSYYREIVSPLAVDHA